MLVALKTLRYAGRRYRAGDRFEAARADARVLCGAQLAAIVAEPARVVLPEPEPLPPMWQLRAEFERLAGFAPDGRWGAARLMSEVEALQDE